MLEFEVKLFVQAGAGNRLRWVARTVPCDVTPDDSRGTMIASLHAEGASPAEATARLASLILEFVEEQAGRETRP